MTIGKGRHPHGRQIEELMGCEDTPSGPKS
jgi:hypothetical protein